MDFGAFVNFMGSRDGLVHVSEIRPERVENVTDVLNEGDIVKVKYLGVDRRGKMKLTMKYINQETGEEIRPENEPTHEGEKKSKKAKKEEQTEE